MPDGIKDTVVNSEDGELADGMEPRDLSIPETKRRTRYADMRHVPVYNVELSSSIHNSEKNKGILKKNNL